MSETRKNFWQKLRDNHLLTAIGAVLVTITMYTSDFFERLTRSSDIALQDEREERALAIQQMRVDDTVRLYNHANGSIGRQLEWMEGQVYKSVYSNPGVRRIALVRWFREHPFGPAKIEDYNLVTIEYEIAASYRAVLKPIYQAADLNKKMRGAKQYLGNVKNKGYPYIWLRWRQTAYDSAMVPQDVRDQFFRAQEIEAYIEIHVGQSEDLKEEWFVNISLDSVLWVSPAQQVIEKKFSELSNNIKKSMLLK